MTTELTLALDASTARGTVAVLRGLEIVSSREAAMRGEDEDLLAPAVAQCCDEAGVAAADLARVVCGAGPGSFTSLRIAAALAKGIATATGCPLFEVSSLALIAAGAAPLLPKGRYVCVIDAHRGEYFALAVDLRDDGSIATDGSSRIVAAAELDRLADELGARVAGPGQDVDAWPLAAGAAALLPRIMERGAVDLISWEPEYGRAPEAQVRWERAHGRPLSSAE